MAAYLKGTLACHGRIVDVGSVAPNGSFWDGWQTRPFENGLSQRHQVTKAPPVATAGRGKFTSTSASYYRLTYLIKFRQDRAPTFSTTKNKGGRRHLRPKDSGQTPPRAPCLCTRCAERGRAISVSNCCGWCRRAPTWQVQAPG